ncbi:MAG: hypothetical protein RIT81_34580 [Deltaproteobacteria bacterium]
MISFGFGGLSCAAGVSAMTVARLEHLGAYGHIVLIVALLFSAFASRRSYGRAIMMTIRRFKRDGLGTALSRAAVRRALRHAGFVLTLADASVTRSNDRSFLTRLALGVVPLSVYVILEKLSVHVWGVDARWAFAAAGPSFLAYVYLVWARPIRLVTTEAELNAAVDRVTKRAARSSDSVFLSRVAALRCSDSLWRQAYMALMREAVAAIIEYRDLSSNMEWELHQLAAARARGAGPGALVMVVDSGAVDSPEAVEQMKRWLDSMFGDIPVTVLLHDEGHSRRFRRNLALAATEAAILGEASKSSRNA